MWRWLGAALWLSFLCGCPTRPAAVRRAALVPALTSPSHPGRLEADTQALSARASYVTSVAPDPTSTSALYLPELLFSGAFRAQGRGLMEGWGGIEFSAGSARGSTTNMTGVPASGLLFGARLGMKLDLPLRERVRLAVAGDGAVYSVPTRIETTCPLSCAGEIQDGRDTVFVLGATVMPKLEWQRFTFFGLATLRNHPDNERFGEVDLARDGATSQVRFGPANVALGVGFEWCTEGRLCLGAQAVQPVSRVPVGYAPVIEAIATLSLPRPGPKLVEPPRPEPPPAIPPAPPEVEPLPPPMPPPL